MSECQTYTTCCLNINFVSYEMLPCETESRIQTSCVWKDASACECTRHIKNSCYRKSFCKMLVWAWIIFKADCTISTRLFLLRSVNWTLCYHRSESLRSAQLLISYRCWLNKIKQYRMMLSRKTHARGKPFEAWPERVFPHCIPRSATGPRWLQLNICCWLCG